MKIVTVTNIFLMFVLVGFGEKYICLVKTLTSLAQVFYKFNLFSHS